jgi:predicted RNA-binding Zn ribbon-like protein
MCYLSQVKCDRYNYQNDIISAIMNETRDAETHHLIGGALCLDFANTLYWHSDVIHEYLFDYRDLVLWGRHAGILSAQKAGFMLSKWEQVPAESEPVLRRAIQMRETIFRIFASLAHAKSPQANDIFELHRAWLEGQAHSRPARTETGFALRWEEGESLDAMLWPITRSAMELLTSDELKRVKQCGRCDWLFVDRSRNLKRRWCSMSACGNRVKMARRYKREKQRM